MSRKQVRYVFMFVCVQYLFYGYLRFLSRLVNKNETEYQYIRFVKQRYRGE